MLSANPVADIAGELVRAAEANPLSDDEIQTLRRVVKRLGRKRLEVRAARHYHPWTHDEDRQLMALIERTVVLDTSLRYRPNKELSRIAAEFGRTYAACRRRIQVLRRRKVTARAQAVMR